jgi:hypothetical protein
VVCAGRIFGKPADEREAAGMLRELSRREHEVVSGVSVVGPGLAERFAVSTTVRFRPLSEPEIAWYVGPGSRWTRRAPTPSRSAAAPSSVHLGQLLQRRGAAAGREPGALARAVLELPWREATP